MNVARQFEKVNRELWVVLSMFIIAAVLNFVVSGQRMVLAFYTLPTVFSAYHYGRRHATLTAVASVLLVLLLCGSTRSSCRTPCAFRASMAGHRCVGGILLVLATRWARSTSTRTSSCTSCARPTRHPDDPSPVHFE